MLVARKFLNLLIFSEEGHTNIRIESTLMLFKSLNRFLGDENKLIQLSRFSSSRHLVPTRTKETENAYISLERIFRENCQEGKQ